MPWTVLLTGGLWGLRTAAQCEEMQLHVQRRDPEDPPETPSRLSTKGSILRQARNRVGTTLSASASLSGPGDGPRPPRMHVHLLPARPGLLAKGLSECSPASGLLAPSLTFISAPRARWGAASCMACGPEQPRRVTSPGPEHVLWALEPAGLPGGGDAWASQSAGSGIQQVWANPGLATRSWWPWSQRLPAAEWVVGG